MNNNTHVSIRHINKVYADGTHALKDINLDVKEGEIWSCSVPLDAASLRFCAQ